MNLKNDNGLDKIREPISLQLMLENDIKTLHSFSGENASGTNKSIHKMRKSLKSISAVLLLYRVQFDHFPELSQLTETLFMLKIKRLRKKALALYPKIHP